MANGGKRPCAVPLPKEICRKARKTKVETFAWLQFAEYPASAWIRSIELLKKISSKKATNGNEQRKYNGEVCLSAAVPLRVDANGHVSAVLETVVPTLALTGRVAPTKVETKSRFIDPL